MNLWILAPIVFTVAIVNDFVWASYIRNVQLALAGRAAAWATGTLLLGAFNIVSYTTQPWLIIPAAAGCMVGTYAAVKRGQS